MNIFLSYASDYKEQADDICCRLQALGHEVFFDREDLPPGNSYDDRIRDAIETSDLFIFLITPESVQQGRYTRTELKIASRKWPTPDWHVLPVEVKETPISTIPPYIRSLTFLQAEGNLTAEVAIEVQDIDKQYISTSIKPQSLFTPAEEADNQDQDTSYHSINLKFQSSDNDSYLLSGMDGNTALSETLYQLDTQAAEHTLWSTANQPEGSMRRGYADTASLLPTSNAVRDVGTTLHDSLFNSDIGDILEAGLQQRDPQRLRGFRFILNTTHSPELARLPWEFLYHTERDDFLFTDRMTPLVRVLDGPPPPEPLALKPPMKILIAIAEPKDQPELAVGKELQQLESALADMVDQGIVEIVSLFHTTVTALDEALLKEAPHVLHFIGHGDVIDNQGVLYLESDIPTKSSITLDSRRFAVMLRNYRTSLRLVFLNSCLGAASTQKNVFDGIAQSLVRKDIPAVIAMQFPIQDETAVLLSRHFYRYLCAGQEVDAALASTRAILFAQGYEVEWGAPTLYMTSPNGKLFDLTAPIAPKTEDKTAAPIPFIALETTEETAPPLSSKSPASLPTKGGKKWILPVAASVIVAIAATALFMTYNSEDKGVEPTPVIPPPIDKTVQNNQGSNINEPEDPNVVETIDAQATLTEAAALIEQAQQNQQTQADLVKKFKDLRLEKLSESQQQQIDELLERAYVTERLRSNDEVSSNLLSLLKHRNIAPNKLDVWVTSIKSAEAQSQAYASHYGYQQHSSSSTKFLTAAPQKYIKKNIVLLGYQIQPGDSLSRIAKRLTGNSNNWPKLLATHNRYVTNAEGSPITDPQKLSIGQTLYVHANKLDYHVQRGDSLSRIAQRVFGDSKQWRRLYELNLDRINDPDKIYPGQVLKLY